MTVFTLTEPASIAPWPKLLCEFGHCASLPTEELVPERQTWSESIIERSFLRRPDVLAQVLGVSREQRLIVLKQVTKIDLYLRTDTGLHLIEAKRPDALGAWPSALDQIARQWSEGWQWLRHSNEPVYLWALCPVRWSFSKRAFKMPPNWRDELEEIRSTRLKGDTAAEIGLVFYSVFRFSGGLLLLMWRADEPAPDIKVADAAD